MLIDIHCHLTHEKLKNQISDVIKRAKEKGVSIIVTSGVNVPTNREVLELTKKYKEIKCTFGLYPIDLLDINNDEAGLSRQIEHFDLDKELKFIEEHKNECIAIGECGLDYHWDKTHHEQQKENFQKIIDFAKKLNKPLLCHTRKAEADCVEMLEKSGIKKVILHMFEGRKHLIKKAADLGYYFSIPVALHKSSHFRMLVEMVNINQLFTETDAPWMSPVPGETNEPSNVALTIQEIAKIKKMNPEEVEANIYMNYQRLFK